MKINYEAFYCGPNRRSDTTLIEIMLDFTPSDLAAIAAAAATVAENMRVELHAMGVRIPAGEPLLASGSGHPMKDFGTWCCTLALLLQRSTGHRVGEQAVLINEERLRATLLFEHEEPDTGQMAGRLALFVVSGLVPGLEYAREPDEEPGTLAQRYAEFKDHSAPLVLPGDTQVIIDAAHRAKVPAVKLERYPYDLVKGEFRIRDNSLIMLGHSAHRRIVDGTFAIEKSAAAAGLLFDRRKAMQALEQAGIPVPAHDVDFRPCLSASRAQRSARRIGFPVVLKPSRRQHGKGVGLAIDGPDALDEARAAATRFGDEVMVEGHVQGRSWRLVVADHELTAAVDAGGALLDPHLVHARTRKAAESLSRSLGVGLMELNIVTPDITLGLQDAGGAAVDLEVAPQLDRYLPPGSAALESVADKFVRWLYPPGSIAGIPMVAVTGTNGKTTTCRMITRIAQAAGFTPGLICTDGQYINDELIEEGDASAIVGHCRIFESQETDFAVMESHHRGIAAFGFAFMRCDVAVCTNVTDDHIGEYGLETEAEMAELKRSLLERADRVVLNADNGHCRAMLPHLDARKICLTSITRQADELAGTFGAAPAFCCIEDRGGAAWISITDSGNCMPIMAVEEIPATFGGAAEFNISNAQAAIAAAWLSGIGLPDIRSALAGFACGFTTTPGRQNEVEGLPFRILVDFAHNPDGVLQISRFVGSLTCNGKKTIAYSGWKSEEHVRNIAGAAAGYFDRYICKNYTPPPDYEPPPGRRPEDIPEIMRVTLMQKGVGAAQIEMVPEEIEAVQYALDTAQKGDLVVLLIGNQVMPQMRELLDTCLATVREPPESGAH